MSLVAVVKGRDGIAMATDSRRTLLLGEFATYDDDDVKLWSFYDAIGVALYGYTGSFGGRIEPVRDAFARTLPADRPSVQELARRLDEFLTLEATRSTAPRKYSMTAVVAGFDDDGTARVYVVEAPSYLAPAEQHAGGIGITWGGQREFVDRLIQGYDARLTDALEGVEGLDGVQMQIRLAKLDLAACADLAEFLVRTTADAQRFIAGIRGVGGPIDVATITRDGLAWVRRKDYGQRVAPVWCELGEAAPAAVEAPADGVRAATYTPAELGKLPDAVQGALRPLFGR